MGEFFLLFGRFAKVRQEHHPLFGMVDIPSDRTGAVVACRKTKDPHRPQSDHLPDFDFHHLFLGNAEKANSRALRAIAFVWRWIGISGFGQEFPPFCMIGVEMGDKDRIKLACRRAESFKASIQLDKGEPLIEKNRGFSIAHVVGVAARAATENRPLKHLKPPMREGSPHRTRGGSSRESG